MISEIADILDGLYGVPCWNAEKGHGSFLTFEFGQPYLEIGEIFEASSPFGFKHKRRPAYVHGAWHLWIYMCHWFISWNDQEICHSESEDLIISRACNFLNGQSLKRVEMKPNGETIFIFDMGGFLKTIPYSDPDREPEDTWLLFYPEKRVLSFRSDGRYSLAQNDEDPSNRMYLEIM